MLMILERVMRGAVERFDWQTADGGSRPDFSTNELYDLSQGT